MDREVAEHEIIDRLFFFWDVSCRGSLSLQVFALKSIKLPDVLIFKFSDIIRTLSMVWMA